MLDIKRIKLHTCEVKKLLSLKGVKPEDVDKVIKLDNKRIELLQTVEEKKAYQNKVSKEIPILKKEGQDTTEVFNKMKILSNEVKELDSNINEIKQELNIMLLNIPNTPSPVVKYGTSEEDNELIRTVGDIPKFDFVVKPHYDLGEALGIVDFKRAVKVSSSRFSSLIGKGALLERALIQFMLDNAIKNGYVELSVPYLVNYNALEGTGNFPKFVDDVFTVKDYNLYLIPTAEVPVTNYHRDEILDDEMLPIKYAAFTPCFRSESGSAGRDTRGLIRMHQFHKVELVKLVKPNESYNELEKLTANAEEILKLLKLPYRTVRLCSGDMSFSGAMTYDIEVWFPEQNCYREISSCTNFEDYQARRANIRYRNEENNKVEYVHTINGSGLALSRTVAAIIENYQNEDGTITVPEVLIEYMNGLTLIS